VLKQAPGAAWVLLRESLCGTRSGHSRSRPAEVMRDAVIGPGSRTLTMGDREIVIGDGGGPCRGELVIDGRR
jgi:hypothetical protein